MNDREVELKDVYEELCKTKDGSKLVRLVKHGRIKADERDKLGRCPLLMAIDTDMKLEVVKELIEGCNCDPKSADEAGDTALHYAVNMDRSDIQDYLLEKVGPQYKEMKNEDGEKPYD